MKTKKEELIKEILNSNTKYNYLILKLLNENKINELIKNITNKKTKLNINSLYKKNYLSPNQHFLMILSNTIYYFKEQFYFLNNNTDFIISILLQNKNNTKYLLTDKYIGNNKNLSFFNYNMKKLITNNYYNNIKKLKETSPIIKKYIKDTNITFNKKDINTIYNNLIKISLCNATNSNNILLFEDINYYTKETEKTYKNKDIKKIVKEFYKQEYEKMIKNYYQKKDIIENLLK